MNVDLRRHALPVAAAFWAALMLAVILMRPLTPVDETRYVTVAWEMRQSGNLLQLRLNGALYGHKPPLLFWLVNAGWSLFGVNEWWPRLLTGLFGLGALALLARLARELAPGRDDVRAMALLRCSRIWNISNNCSPRNFWDRANRTGLQYSSNWPRPAECACPRR